MATFSDDFNRADGASLGANWTEDIAGAQEILSNQLYFLTLSAKSLAVYSGTTCSTTDQYARVKVSANVAASNYPGLVFRYTNSVSPYYWIYFGCGEQNVSWAYHPDVATGNTDIASSAITVALNDVFGITINGTGASTVVRIWRNPTATAPDTGGTTWDGASPTVTFTTDPASPVDTGSMIGVQAYDFSSHVQFDDFYAGDITPVATIVYPTTATIFLYAGQLNPNDIELGDPLTDNTPVVDSDFLVFLL